MSETSSPEAGGKEPTQPLPASSDTLAGGRYVLGRRLGAGGMGLVIRATDHLLDRDVAVKLLADNLAADADARERFLREARAAARIVDPHVVAVYDVGEDAGRPYIVMELVDGPSLADVLHERGPLGPVEVAGAAADALAGLSRAHEAGLLHRDVKPGNLLRAPNGTVKVTDFGVAEAGDAPGLTRTGFVIGTRSYLAPERRRGGPATPATDLYALGVTLTQLLTGRMPGTDTAPPMPAGTPAGLRRVLPMLLSHDPHDRPATAAEALAIMGGRHPARRSAPTAGARASASSGDSTALLASDATPAPAGGATGGPDTTADTATAALPGSALDATSRDVPTVRKRHWTRRVVVAVAAASLAVVVAALSQSRVAPPGDDSDGPPAQPAAEVLRVDDDPARTARNLADWLREHAER